MRVAIYCRVSTAQQDDEAQYEELVALCKRSHWEIVRVYREKVSGTKSAADRPELKKLLIEAKQRKFEKVLFGVQTGWRDPCGISWWSWAS